MYIYICTISPEFRSTQHKIAHVNCSSKLSPSLSLSCSTIHTIVQPASKQKARVHQDPTEHNKLRSVLRALLSLRKSECLHHTKSKGVAGGESQPKQNYKHPQTITHSIHTRPDIAFSCRACFVIRNNARFKIIGRISRGRVI